MQDRKEKIKSGLDNDIYSKIDQLEDLKDDTLSSTSKLVNILDGYETKVDNIDFERPSNELEIFDEEDMEIEINDQEILDDYNNKIHGVGLNTLDDLLSEAVPSYTKELSAPTQELDEIDTENFDPVKNTSNMEESQEIFTQNIKSPEMIDDFEIDDTVVPTTDAVDKKEPKVEHVKTEVKEKASSGFDFKEHIIDIILGIILIILVIYLISTTMGG